MAINFKCKYNFGDCLYVIDDPEQLPRTLVGIYLSPGMASYELSIVGEVITVYEFEVTPEPDQVRLLNLKEK